VERGGSAAGGWDQDLGGVRTIAAETASAVRDTPELILLFLVVAPLSNVPAVGGFIAIVGQGVGIALVANHLDGLNPMPENSLGVRLIVLIVSAIIAGIAIIVGLILLVIPGVFLWVRFYLAPPAVIVDDCGPVEALAESWSRTVGNTVTVFGVALAVVVLGVGAGAVVLLSLAGGPDAAIERIRSGNTLISLSIVGFVNSLLIAAASTVMYARSETGPLRS
jgi:hypothetical protein